MFCDSRSVTNKNRELFIIEYIRNVKTILDNNTGFLCVGHSPSRNLLVTGQSLIHPSLLSYTERWFTVWRLDRHENVETPYLLTSYWV